jgi:hypothetical protein
MSALLLLPACSTDGHPVGLRAGATGATALPITTIEVTTTEPTTSTSEAPPTSTTTTRPTDLRFNRHENWGGTVVAPPDPGVNPRHHVGEVLASPNRWTSDGQLEIAFGKATEEYPDPSVHDRPVWILIYHGAHLTGSMGGAGVGDFWELMDDATLNYLEAGSRFDQSRP